MNVLMISVRADMGGGPKHLYDLSRCINKTYPEGIEYEALISKLNHSGNGTGEIYYTDFKALNIK